MGQQEVIDWLITQRKKGNNQFFTPSEIHKGMNECNKKATYKAINKLYMFGYTEREIVQYIPARWKDRIKEKYLT